MYLQAKYARIVYLLFSVSCCLTAAVAVAVVIEDNIVLLLVDEFTKRDKKQ